VSARGAIHDLGYARYVGTRRPPGTRWRVIARHEVAMAWKGWWRYKAPLAIAVIGTFVAGAMLYELSGEVWKSFGGRFVVMWTDSILPLSFVWYARAGFLVSLTIGGATIAGDVDGGALPFYFARSTRPRDYLAGKLAGYGLVVATIVAAGPLALALFRLGLSGSSVHQLVLHLSAVPEALAVGALATLAYAAVPLGFSALIANRRYALGAWAAYYLIGGAIAIGIGTATSHAWIEAIDLGTAVDAIASHLFGVGGVSFHGLLPGAHVPLAPAIASVVVQAGAALALALWRIARVRAAGVGGGS
jgi:hypothetical protein